MSPDYTKGGYGKLSGMLEWTVVEFAPGLALRLTASPAGLRSIEFDPGLPLEGAAAAGNAFFDEAARQLRDYFDGALQVFTLPLDPQGTDFQKRVWREL